MFEHIDGLSLDSLRVFESAARQLSFTAAAHELGSSQPAISQQIKRLEQQLATRLFDRVYRGIALTEAGELLLGYVQDGLHSLNAGLAAVTAQQQHEVLQVATDFAFAAYWLMPRLPRFHRLHPEVDVSLITSERDHGALPAEIDVAINFGDGRFKHAEAQLLFREEVFPVCSPGLLEGQALPLPPAALAGLPLGVAGRLTPPWKRDNRPASLNRWMSRRTVCMVTSRRWARRSTDTDPRALTSSSRACWRGLGLQVGEVGMASVRWSVGRMDGRRCDAESDLRAAYPKR